MRCIEISVIFDSISNIPLRDTVSASSIPNLLLGPFLGNMPYALRCLQADNAVSGRSIFDAIQDTEAFVTANDESIMLVFRGTQEMTDWATNLNAIRRRVPEEWGLAGEGCDVHQVRPARYSSNLKRTWCRVEYWW